MVYCKILINTILFSKLTTQDHKQIIIIYYNINCSFVVFFFLISISALILYYNKGTYLGHLESSPMKTSQRNTM